MSWAQRWIYYELELCTVGHGFTPSFLATSTAEKTPNPSSCPRQPVLSSANWQARVGPWVWVLYVLVSWVSWVRSEGQWEMHIGLVPRATPVFLNITCSHMSAHVWKCRYGPSAISLPRLTSGCCFLTLFVTMCNNSYFLRVSLELKRKYLHSRFIFYFLEYCQV